MGNKHGTLTSSVSNRGGGRKIDTLTFRADAPKGEGNKQRTMDFDVYLQPDHSFVVQTKDIPGQRWKDLRGGVLAELALQAEEAARDEFNLQANLTWSTWLEVRVIQPGEHNKREAVGGKTAAARVSYRPIARGETPDGRAFTPGGNNCLVEFPSNVGVVNGNERRTREIPKEELAGLSDGLRMARQMDNLDRRPTNEQYTYLPDTPEARAGLDAIIAAIDTINVRLQAFLQPGEINLTLERAAQSGLRMLEAPEGDAASPRPKGPR